MGNSAVCDFFKTSRTNSAYYFHHCEKCGTIGSRSINVDCISEEVSLSSFIHEVNECEVVDLLNKIMNDFIQEKQTIVFDVELREKYKTFMDTKRHVSCKNAKEPVLISHIISPYGCCGCIYPNYKFRTRW